MVIVPRARARTNRGLLALALLFGKRAERALEEAMAAHRRGDAQEGLRAEGRAEAWREASRLVERLATG